MLTSSCSSALHLAFQSLHLTAGSEVIVPSFAFASCASVMLSLGLRPVFADSKPNTLNIDVDHVARLIGPRTGAILIVHYAGVACEMDDLIAISHKHRLPLIEDAAHALFGKYHCIVIGQKKTMSPWLPFRTTLSRHIIFSTRSSQTDLIAMLLFFIFALRVSRPPLITFRCTYLRREENWVVGRDNVRSRRTLVRDLCGCL